jgi:thiol:disulfide interchange protein DsbD
VKKLITVLSLLLFLQIAQPAESENKTATGLTRIQFVTDVSRVVPGEEITVALVLKPDNDFHIYWRGPGIVGVAPIIEWDLPEGFEPGAIEWPAPVKVDMVGIMANGFKSETWLLSTIRVPEKVVSEQIEIRAKIAWMACAATCHPGIERLSLTLPAGETAEKDETISKRFTKIRSQLPPPSPKGWGFSVSSPEANTIELDVVVPNLKWSDDTVIDFFCDDFQVDSSVATASKTLGDGKFTLTFTRPDFGPKKPKYFSGVLYSETGWPDTESKWVEVKTSWKHPKSKDE